MYNTILIALILLMPLGASAQKDGSKVEDAVDALYRAMTTANIPVLEQLASDQLSYGHSSGKVEDKTAWLSTLRNGTSDFVSMETKQQSVTIIGNTAVVRHELYAQTNDSGNPGKVKLYILLVWQKQQSHWKLIARQAVKM